MKGNIVRIETCNLLRCTACRRGALKVSGPTPGPIIDNGCLLCSGCGASFNVRNGIPILLEERILGGLSDSDSADKATRQKIQQREWHDHSHIDNGDNYKQSAYRDPGLFAFLLHYQLREMEGVLAKRRYARVANICCGHGFELEYVSRLSHDIIVADISLNSLYKTLAKAATLGIQVEALCCDAENLPLRDDSCDLVLTHHSLHHLANPMLGVEEMLRISSSRIVFFEPARGAMRTLVRFAGLKDEIEEAGNFVYEFSRAEVKELCRKTGYQLHFFSKCLITGPTSEPRIFKQMDSARISPVISSGITMANRLLGGVIGTKCSVIIEKNGT